MLWRDMGCNIEGCCWRAGSKSHTKGHSYRLEGSLGPAFFKIFTLKEILEISAAMLLFFELLILLCFK